MRARAPSRRMFLAGLLAASLPAPTWADVGSPAYVSAGMAPDGSYVLHGLSKAGQSLFVLPLPARGHAAAVHPARPLAVAFARRPGTFALVMDCRDGRVLHRLTPPAGRQFNGHGAFSADGGLLMTSEVIADGSQGRIGLWDAAAGYRRIGEWASGGIGPHEIRRLGENLVVANGGIQTDPDDRSKLNIDTMRPNLTLLGQDGAILERAELDSALRQNSIRHLALGRDGTVAFAMQWEGPGDMDVPQLGLWQPGRAPRLCPAPEAEAKRMQGYAGSIAMAQDGRVAITSPRGGAVMIFAPNGTHLATYARADICGIAACDDGFIASDGLGAVWRLGADGLRPLAQNGPKWDNHMVAVG